MRIALIGEALIDFTGQGGLTFEGHPGGSPYNTAVACARLGQPPYYLTQLSTDTLVVGVFADAGPEGIARCRSPVR